LSTFTKKIFILLPKCKWFCCQIAFLTENQKKFESIPIRYPIPVNTTVQHPLPAAAIKHSPDGTFLNLIKNPIKYTFLKY